MEREQRLEDGFTFTHLVVGIYDLDLVKGIVSNKLLELEKARSLPGTRC